MIRIKVDKLTYTYPNSSKPALVDVSLEVSEGITLITGGSASGKTTLAMCMAGVIPHALKGGELKGRVLIDGVDVSEMRLSEITRKVGIVFQDPESQFFLTTVEEELAFGMENLCFPREEIARRVEELLDLTGLKEMRKRRPSTLSGGQKQKLAIASILAMNPSIIILDEPTCNLDSIGIRMVYDMLLKLRESGKTIVLIERRFPQIIQYVDKVFILNKGRIVMNSKPREILEDEEAIKSLGLEIPQIVELGYVLRRKGLIDRIPLSVEELLSMLGENP